MNRKGEDGKWQTATVRPVHDDPWKTHAAREYLGRVGKPLSEITVWNGDLCRITDQLPPRLLTCSKGSKPLKNSLRFFEIQDDEMKFNFLKKHTHWGKSLMGLRRIPVKDNDGNVIRANQAKARFADKLWVRIKSFLKAEPDPFMPKELRSAIWEETGRYPTRKERSLRFIELLKTVDGVFM